MDSVVILAPPRGALVGRLAALATASGHQAEIVGDVLLVHGPRLGLDELTGMLASTISAPEAASTRVLFLDQDPREGGPLDVLAPALEAESLATIAARELHGRMLDALSNGEGVHSKYQPIVDVRSGVTSGFEALLRLEHGGRTVPPLEVFRAAADTGRLDDADAAARRAALENAAGWIGRRRLFLNVHPESIGHPDDMAGTDAAVGRAGLLRAQIVFEAAARSDTDPRHLVRVLDHLRSRGYGIGLDEVTHDSAKVIEEVRPDVVKVAMAVVKELPELHARSTVAVVVGAAHAVGARVVAKGVESGSQLDAAVFIGVDDAQGWQLGQPMRPPRAGVALAS